VLERNGAAYRSGMHVALFPDHSPIFYLRNIQKGKKGEKILVLVHFSEVAWRNCAHRGEVGLIHPAAETAIGPLWSHAEDAVAVSS
jgi:hypothetical protein